MNEKIMGLIELAMQFNDAFKSKIYAGVEYGGHINGISVYICNNGKINYRKVCYLEWDNAEAILDSMKKDLEEMLKQNKVA